MNLRKSFEASQLLQNVQLKVIIKGRIVLLKMCSRKAYNEDFDDSEIVCACVQHIENGPEAPKVQSLVYDVAVNQDFGQQKCFALNFEIKSLLLQNFEVQQQVFNQSKLVIERDRFHI